MTDHPSNQHSVGPDPGLAPVERRFRRSTEGSIGGVGRGIADYFDLNVRNVRLALVIGGLVSFGIVFVSYIAMWLLVPTTDDPDPRPFAITNKFGPLLFGTLFVVGALAIGVSSTSQGGELVVPSLLIVGGVYLLTQQEDKADGAASASATATTAGATSMPFTAPASAYSSADTIAPPGNQPPPNAAAAAPADYPSVDPAPPLLQDHVPRADDAQRSTYDWAIPRVDDPAPPRVVAPEPPAQPKPPITAMSLAGAAVLIGVLAMVDQLGADIGTRSYMGAAAATIGLGLIVSSAVGRAWRLIPLGFLAISTMAVGPIFDGAASGGVGPKEVRVTAEEDLRSTYSVGAGYYEIDMRQLTISEDRTVTVDVGAGYAEILVPADTNLRINGGSTFGYVDLFGQEVAGIANSATRGRNLNDGPTLTIDVQTEFGYVEVK